MPDVEYRDIQGHPGYRVGNDGSVWTCKVYVGRGKGWWANGSTWSRLVACVGKSGYLHVSIGPGVKLVHRLVLEAFVGPCPDGMESRHFPDRTRTNCALSNLSWATKKANQADRRTHGTHMAGESHPSSILTSANVLAIRARLANGEHPKVIGKDFGVTHDAIRAIRDGKTWKSLKE